MNLWLMREGQLTEFGMVMHTLLYLKQVTKKDLLYKHMKLCSMLCGSLYVSGVWGRMDTCICMSEFLSLPKIITTLLISYTSMQY